MNATILKWILILALAGGFAAAAGEAAAPALERGATVLKIDFDTPADRETWKLLPSTTWTPDGPKAAMSLRVEAAEATAGARPVAQMIALPIDLTPYRGLSLEFEGQAKADGVSRPEHGYNGVKFMLHFKAASGERWVNQTDVFGTFDWKTLSFAVPIPEDAGAGEICLGLQDSSGKAWFRELRAKILRTRSPILPEPDPKAAPPYKGHDLPRLRGVMSPNAFKDEDLRNLGMEWKANLIRWQITRNWGQNGTERDLDEYDSWLNGRLDELDQALAACKKYGIKAVIDLHSPPGGRDENRDMAMFYEKKYQDHFVAVWEKIAKRYKDNSAVWGYDLVNEPTCNKLTLPGMDSLATQVRAARAIRAIDAKTAIIIESENWDSPEAFAWLTPIDVPNVVYQVHMYTPHTFTHQGVFSKTVGITYPGTIDGKQYDKDALKKVLQPVRDFQRAYNVHIYVGEFSAIRWAPGAARYLEDCVSIFEEYGWDWSYHAYREWPGWSVEHENLPVDKDHHTPAATDTDRKKVLLNWFAKNEKPDTTKAKGQ